MSENQQNNSNQVAGALTFPVRNEENAQALPDQPRQPANLQGLLRFAMEATRTEGARVPDYLPMNEERRKFLEEAFSCMTVDMTEVIRSALKILSDEDVIGTIQLGDPLPENVRTAFDNLLELVDDLDVANDFYKMGGFAIFPVCLGSENDSVRALACSVLGEVCQNNPFCQVKTLECGLLEVVLSLVQGERGEALAKGLYALSCACREFEPACNELVALGGCGALARLLRAEEPAARTKAAFLVRYLCHNHREAKEKFIDQNLVQDIAAQIKSGRDSTTEHLLGVLLALMEGRDPAAVAQFADPAVGLRFILQDHLGHPDLIDDTFTEEKQYCEELLTIMIDCPHYGSVGVVETHDR